jgi:hypothetical protein
MDIAETVMNASVFHATFGSALSSSSNVEGRLRYLLGLPPTDGIGFGSYPEKSDDYKIRSSSMWSESRWSPYFTKRFFFEVRVDTEVAAHVYF